MPGTDRKKAQPTGSSSGKLRNFQLDTLRRVLAYVSGYRWELAATLALAAVSVISQLYIPILTGNAINLIVGAGKVDFGGIAPILLRIAVLVAAGAAAQWVMNICSNRIAYGVVRDIREDAFSHLQQLPLSYLDSHPSGDIVSRIIADADQFSDGLLMGFTRLFSGVITIAGTLAFMFAISAPIAIVVVVLTPVSLFAAGFIAKHTYSMFRLQSDTRGEQTALIDEMIGNQKTVQAFRQEKEVQERFDEVNGRLEKCSMRATFFSSLTNPCTRFVNSLVYAAVAVVGGLSAIAGGISVGQLYSFLSYANQYTKPFNEISGVVAELENALACARRLLDLIDEKPQTPDAENAEVLTEVKGQVGLKDVCFSYVPDRKLIEHLNLSVKPGQHIAIVGPTGCGKTTLINLLMRFYDPDSGTISVEGKDIRGVTRASLRLSYGMVLQDTWLSSGTVRENLLMAKPDASEEEMVRAAVLAHADGFIRRLPEGYDTPLGEGGGRLSQGQKQLLCIARAMLSLPPMLILDEATSSIDTRTEMKIQDSFAAMMKGRTSFVVAHRLSTIRTADLILVMKNGHVIEQGTHDELLAKGGFYSELYNSQWQV